MATDQINKLNERVSEYDQLKNNYETMRKENNELQEKLESQQMDFVNKNALNEKNLEEYRENLIQLSDTRMQLDQAKKDIASLKNTLVNFKNNMIRLRETKNTLQQENEGKDREIERLKEEMQQKENSFVQQLEQCQIERNQADQYYQQEIENYKAQIQQYIAKINSCETLIKEQEDQIQVFKISESNNNVTNLRNEFDQDLVQFFEIKDRNIEEKKKQLNESFLENERLRKIIAEKEKEAVECDYLKGVLEKKQLELTELQRVKGELETVNQELLNSLAEEKRLSQEKIATLKEMNEELRQQNSENDRAIQDCRQDVEKKVKEIETMEKALTDTQKQLDKEKNSVISIQSEYNNCQNMYQQAMVAIKKLEDTQTLLQQQLEGSKLKNDEIFKNYKESQDIIKQNSDEKKLLTQQKEESLAEKEEELRYMKKAFIDAIETLQAQYVELKVYNDFLRKEIRKLKGIPENILMNEVDTTELDATKNLYKKIENQRIQIENLQQQLELSLKF